MFFFLLGCENNLQMILPQGPQGEKGEKGDDGLSAFELWKIFYGKDSTVTLEDFFNSLKGKDGKDGAVPYVGDNGNWWIDGTDTGIPARGQDGADGKDGVTPTIGDNGNWWIDGKDTGVPARGQDGADGFTPYIGENENWWINGEDTGVPARGKNGEDGQTPTVEIGPGPGYYWIINGVTTTVSAKGKDGEDGKDGYTPEIGGNGNWWIGGVDTGNPSVVIPEIGSNGNWWIGGSDTGKPSKGADGVDGKTAYELWKEAVDLCDGTVKNKDGSAYDCTKNSWEDFLIWLQGGDFSVLHQYWLSQGNTGDLNAFLEALFSCHCDGITIIVIAADECVELKSDGSLNKVYNATLKVGGTAGTSVTVTGSDVDANGTIAAGQTEVSFTVPRSDVNKTLTINCTLSGSAEQVTKTAIIPALKYIKLDTSNPVTVTKVASTESDEVSITFTTPPAVVSVDGSEIYTSSGGAVSGWSISNGNKTFKKTYERKATSQTYSVQAKGSNGECSTLNNLFTIPQLTPVEDFTAVLSIVDNCNLKLTVTGTSGMTVKATSTTPVVNLTLTEGPAGTYITSEIPRAYTAYNITITASKDGAGTKTKSVTVNGANLITVQNPLTISMPTAISTNEGNLQAALVPATLTNNTSASLTVELSRGNNTVSGANKQPFPNSPIIIGAGSSVNVNFYRDYAIPYTKGDYTVTFKTINECGLSKSYTQKISNQTGYSVEFQEPVSWGNDGNPDDLFTFDVILTDGIPNSYVEFQLKTSDTGYRAIFRAQVGADGKLTKSVTLKRSEIQKALADGYGYFYFYNSDSYITKYQIGSDKEKVVFEF